MTAKPEQLTYTEAYAAMVAFLNKFNSTYKSEDVSILLSGLELDGSKRPMDQAYEQEWLDCIKAVKSGAVDIGARLSR